MFIDASHMVPDKQYSSAILDNVFCLVKMDIFF